MSLGVPELLSLAIALLLPVAFAYGTGKVAEGKGHPFMLWAVIGFFSTIIGLIVIAVIPPADGRSTATGSGRAEQ